MKKRLSAAGLGLRLTAAPVAAVILAASLLQIWSFYRTEYLWSGELGNAGFEWILDEEGVGLWGKLSFIGILVVTVGRTCSARNRASYTLRRLRIREGEVTFLWAVIFSGYFLVSWAVQLGLVLWMYVQYAAQVGTDGIGLFAASYRSAYFHLLLPLEETLGYLRNILICVGWGGMGAMMARYMRHGGKPFMAVALILVTGFFLPGEMASMSTDIVLCVAICAMVIVHILINRGWGRDED